MASKQPLQSILENRSKGLGADIFGAADLTIAKDYICQQGGEYLGRFPRAISIGIRLLDTIVDGLHRHEDPSVASAYLALYNTVNAHLDHITLLLAKTIEDEGYSAYAVPATQPVIDSRLYGIISHKLVADLAGLGWIGKSCLLITPAYGPRVRLATILTDAPLETGRPVEVNCGSCRRCVEICPAKAFTGAPFDPWEPREARFKAQECYSYQNRLKEKIGAQLCGLCVYICPYGRKKGRNSDTSK